MSPNRISPNLGLLRRLLEVEQTIRVDALNIHKLKMERVDVLPRLAALQLRQNHRAEEADQTHQSLSERLNLLLSSMRKSRERDHSRRSVEQIAHHTIETRGAIRETAVSLGLVPHTSHGRVFRTTPREITLSGTEGAQ